jgi:hypothetical protein
MVGDVGGVAVDADGADVGVAVGGKAANAGGLRATPEKPADANAVVSVPVVAALPMAVCIVAAGTLVLDAE